MKLVSAWMLVILSVVAVAGCDVRYEDAVIDGVTTFITEAISEGLSAMLPVADIVSQAGAAQ
jgi:hypothetical protein